MKRLLALLTFLALATLVAGQGGNTVTIRFPGAPSGNCSLFMYAVNNATGEFYDCLAGSWNLVTGGGGGGSGTVSPNNGTAGAGAYYPAAAGSTTVDDLSGLTYDSVGNATLAQGTITASTPWFSHTGTWNAAGVVFTGFLSNTTTTARANASRLFDWQVGGTTQFALQYSSTAPGEYQLIMPTLAALGAPSVIAAASPTSGIGFSTNDVSVIRQSSRIIILNATTGPLVGSGRSFGFSSNADPSSAVQDTGIGRSAAGVVSADTTAAGNGLGAFIATAYQTKANCSANGTAANPSVVTCTAAASGTVSCDVASSAGTCTINTTAVTANSNILVTFTAAANTRLSVTCNTSPTFGAVPTVSAISAGTSFTINVPTIVTNPVCLSYMIVN